jgi:hypothetical protein
MQPFNLSKAYKMLTKSARASGFFVGGVHQMHKLEHILEQCIFQKLRQVGAGNLVFKAGWVGRRLHP